MPGIVGLISKMPRAECVLQLERMLKAIRHEPFHHEGIWIDERLGIYAGWTAIAGSFGERMPLRDTSGTLSLILSGEVYDGEIGPRDMTGDGAHGTLLAELALDGERFPASLNGLFHGVVADRGRETATLFNDRYGMHRLYYHESPEAFYFACEAKAILAARPELRVPCPRGLAEFLAFSCVLENRTVFRDIFVLPAAARWDFADGRLLRKTTYFDPAAWEEQAPLDFEGYSEELAAALARNLPAYFSGSEPVGLALTGGMDTRVLLASYKPSAGSVNCYTFGGPFRESQDVRLARQVAAACGQSYRVISVGNEFLKRFAHYAEQTIYLTEGTADVYRSSDLYVSELARAIAPVKVVGTYGSEILRHAVMFKPMPPPAELLSSDMAPLIQEARETYAAVRSTHPVTFAAFRQSPWYHHGILALEQTQLTVRSPYLDNSFVAAAYRAPQTAGPGPDVRLRLISNGDPALARIPSDRGVGGSLGPVASRVVHGIHEFTFKAEYAYDYGMPQPVARIDHWLRGLHLERLFLGRHKFGHYRVWYRDALAPYVREMLLDSKTLSRPYVNAGTLEQMVTAHLHGIQNHTTAIHKMLSLELLQRLFFDASSESGSRDLSHSRQPKHAGVAR